MSGIPHVVIDGVINEIGADLCPVMVGVYSNDIEARMAATGGVSPVKITGDLAINGSTATLTAHFELIDPGTFNAHQGTLFIYEDDITWCCGYGGEDHWDEVVRMVRSTPVTLTTVGQVETVVQNLNITGMNPANLHAAVVYEQIAGAKTIIQSSDLVPMDYALDFPTRVESVPQGTDLAYFSGTVSNIGESADVVTLAIDNAFGWPADFQIEGDPNYYQSHDVALGIGESMGITVRVQTDGVKRIGAGHFSGTSQNTGRVTNITLRVFNNSYAILLVDDDNNTVYQDDFTNALNSLGYLYDTVTSAGAASMRGFDCVMWETAYQTSNTIVPADQEALIEYLNGGGRLYLSSMDFLSSVTLPNTFVTDYLGVASFTINSHSARAVGVGGDPITNGMDMALNWPSGPANRVDTVNPGANASIIFNSDTGNPAALRFEGGRNFRTVFNSICQDAFPTAGSDPNNNETVIEKSLLWLLDFGTSGVGDQAPVAGSLILNAGPNPAHGSADISFALSAGGAGAVKLTLVDASGRQVRSLFTGAMEPGSHRLIWNGMDDAGHPVSSGLYFARLETTDGVSTGKIVMMR